MRDLTKLYTYVGWIALLYLIVLFWFPVAKGLITSVTINHSISMDNYVKIFSSNLYLKVFFKTLWISVISTVIALILGYCFAYFIVNQPSKKQGIWLIVIISPKFLSLTVRLFGWMIILSKNGPIVNLLTKILGEGNVISLLFSPIAVVIGIVQYGLPFVVLNIYSSLKRLETSLPEAAIMLGASRWRTFWTVVFPLSLPGVYAACAVAFSLSASTFLVPLMLGGPSDNLLADLAFTSIVTIGNIGMGAALSFVLLAIVVIVLLVMGRMERRGQLE
jgi:ABC-type spermidine/putrescine transport system permease subunit I